jgi:hypothetical protein
VRGGAMLVVGGLGVELVPWVVVGRFVGVEWFDVGDDVVRVRFHESKVR